MRKKLILLFLLNCLSVLALSAGPITLDFSREREIELKFRAPELKISNENILNEEFQVLSMAESSGSAEPGTPDLPVFSGSIILPPTGSYHLQIDAGRSKTISNIRPLPVFDTEEKKSQLLFDRGKYNESAPKALVETGEIAILRDFRVLQFNVNPVHWDANSNNLKVYEEIGIKISFTDEKGELELPAYSDYSPAFRKIYEANLLNFEDYRNLHSGEEYGRILMIYPNGVNTFYMTMVNMFANWKKQKGHEVNLVSTQETGSSSSAIKNFIQIQYNDPATRPDYIILIGDTPQIPTHYENFSNYNGEGDYPYTFLAGDDYLGDAFIGRISVETADQLSTVLSKVYKYEKDIANDATAAAWLNRILLIGDPSTSGISCVYNSKYIKELAERVNPDYSFIENYSSGFSSTINSGINEGVNFFSYRGYINMSGWSPSSSLNNGSKLPHAVILTCGTGNFGSSYGTGTTETFIRLGTAQNPSGAVTAIGMATSGTHTMFNNTLNAAIFNGIFAHNMRSMGEALLNGRLYIREVYGATNSNEANYFAHWCNLMGDPSMEVFVGIPESLQINAPTTLTLGTVLLDVSITDANGNPMANASVTAFSEDENQIVARGYTDEFGNISLHIEGGISSSLLLTAAKNDKKPAQIYVEPDVGGLVHHDIMVVDDGSSGSLGNGNNLAEAGERIALMLSAKNTGDVDLVSLSGTVSSEDPYIELLSEGISFPDISAGESALAQEFVVFDIAHNLPGYHDIRLVLSITDEGGTQYQFPIHVASHNAILHVESVDVLAGSNSVLDPAETGTLNLGIMNNSIAVVENVSAQLFSLNDLVLVEDSEAYIGTINADSMSWTLDSFGLFARSLLVPGMQIPFRLRLSNEAGFMQDAYFNISIGNVNQHTPMGPDSYGYFIYDMTDIQFSDCPTYEWIEIDPGIGGGGIRLNTLSDSGANGDEGDQNGSTTYELVDLPFTFPFYGVPYNQITVSTNGFIAMGETQNSEFRNSRLPGGLGPSPMIAAFWDDLILMGDSGIYKYFDTANHLFIIEYSKMRNGFNRSSLETFQIIFYDPSYHPTSYGDGKIKIQYKDFNNVDVGGGGYTPNHGNYATIGIKDHSNTVGLEYTYNNQYAPGAAPLSNNSALLITTVPVLHEAPYLIVHDLIVTDPNGNNIAEPTETVELGIRLINQGLNTATEATVSATINHPYASIVNGTSDYPDISGDNSAVNKTPITVYIEEDCPDGSIIDLMLHITNGESEWNYPVDFTVRRPSITVSSYMMNDAAGNGNGLAEPGETIEMVVNFSNISEIDVNNLNASIMSVSPYVTIQNSGDTIPFVPALSTVQMMFPVTLSQDTPLGNNITFYISFLGDHVNVGTSQLLVSVGTTGMSEDFEYDNGYFEPSPSYNGWEWGQSEYAGAHSGTKIWGTRLDADFSPGAAYNLTTQPVYIGANFMLEFWHKYNTGTINAGGNVKISTNGGSVWQVLTPENGYPAGNVVALAGPGFQGVQEVWQQVKIPLASYGNQTVQFRFSFGAPNYGGVAPGWFIDDVRTSGYLAYAGKVEGMVSSSDPNMDFSQVYVINANRLCVSPDAEGFYQLYMPLAEHQVSAVGEGYYSMDSYAITLTEENPIVQQDFYLNYLKPVSDVSHQINQDLLSLSWNPPLEPDFPIYSYEVYRRYAAGAFELAAELQSPIYQESLVSHGDYKYYVVAKYVQGSSKASELIAFSWGGSDTEEAVQIPLMTSLNGNYPNPFNPETNIAFSLAADSPVRLCVYNLKGQKVAELFSGNLPAGEHSKVWNGRDYHGRSVSSGIYLIRLEAESATFTRKMMLMK